MKSPSNAAETIKNISEGNDLKKAQSAASATNKLSLAIRQRKTTEESTLFIPLEAPKTDRLKSTQRESIRVEGDLRDVKAKPEVQENQIEVQIPIPNQKQAVCHFKISKLSSPSGASRSHRSEMSSKLSNSLRNQKMLQKMNTSETIDGTEDTNAESTIQENTKANKQRSKGTEYKSMFGSQVELQSPGRATNIAGCGLLSPAVCSPKKKLSKKIRKTCKPNLCNIKDISKIYTHSNEKILPWFPANFGLNGPIISSGRNGDKQNSAIPPLRRKPYLEPIDVISKLKSSDDKHKMLSAKSNDLRVATWN